MNQWQPRRPPEPPGNAFAMAALISILVGAGVAFLCAAAAATAAAVGAW